MNTQAVNNRIAREVGRAMMNWDGMSDLGKGITDAITACTEAPPAPGAWLSAESLVDLPEVDTAIRALLADPTHDNAVGVVVSVLAAAQAKPIDMVLHCTECGLQHIDAPERNPTDLSQDDVWTNQPHRSHLCHGCGHIWRPADVCTNGVAAVKTAGKNDSPVASAQAQTAEPAVAEWISDVIRDVAELDYTSPDGMPDGMVVGAAELRAILESRGPSHTKSGPALDSERYVSAAVLSRMFVDMNGRDPHQRGSWIHQGWNKALRQAMDYAMPLVGFPDGGMVPVVDRPGA
jgi:hypothetical protein